MEIVFSIQVLVDVFEDVIVWNFLVYQGWCIDIVDEDYFFVVEFNKVGIVIKVDMVFVGNYVWLDDNMDGI